MYCFNPCSNGLSAQSPRCIGYSRGYGAVSILVLMDFRLKVSVSMRIEPLSPGFNPCSNGLSAQSLEEPPRWS